MGLNTGEIIAIFIIIVVLLIITLIACYKCWRSMTKMHRDSSKPSPDFMRNLQQSFRQSLRRVGRARYNEASQIPVSYHRQRPTPPPPRMVNLDDPASERSDIHPRYLPHHQRDAPPTYAEALTHQKVEDRGRRHLSYQSKTSSHSLNTISSHVPCHPNHYHPQPLYAVSTKQKARQQDDQQLLHVPTGLVYSGQKYAKPPKPHRNKLKNLQSLKYLSRKDDSGSEYASTDSTSDGDDERVEIGSVYSERYVGTPNEYNQMTPHFSTYNERYVGSPTEIDNSYREMRDKYLGKHREFDVDETPVKREREGFRRNRTSNPEKEEIYAVPHAKAKATHSNLRMDPANCRNIGLVNENSHRDTGSEGNLEGWNPSFERYSEINRNMPQTGNAEAEKSFHSHRHERRKRHCEFDYNRSNFSVSRTASSQEGYDSCYGQEQSYRAKTGGKYREHGRKYPYADSRIPLDSYETPTQSTLSDQHVIKRTGIHQCYKSNSFADSNVSVRPHEVNANSARREPEEMISRSDTDNRRTYPYEPPTLKDVNFPEEFDGSDRQVYEEHGARNSRRVSNNSKPFVGPLRALDGEEVIAGSIARGQIITSSDLRFEGSAFVPVVSRHQRNNKTNCEHFTRNLSQQNNVVFNQDADSIGLDTYI